VDFGTRRSNWRRNATIAVIAIGLFCLPLSLGFILLPAATMQEKALLVGASSAVSVVALTAAGAWRSQRAFGLTVLAGAMAIGCLADLSIAAANGAKATTAAAGDHQPLRTSAPEAVYLTDQSWTAASGPHQVAPATGPWTINGFSYVHSLGYTAGMCLASTNSITDDLGGSYDHFLSEVGMADGWLPGDQQVTLTFTVFGKTESGQFTELNSRSAQAGRPSSLTVEIPAGTKELRLTTHLVQGCVRGTIVWGNARVTR
jgi:hypothetical protein